MTSKLLINVLEKIFFVLTVVYLATAASCIVCAVTGATVIGNILCNVCVFSALFAVTDILILFGIQF